MLTRRAPENGLLLVALAAALAPAVWTARGVVWASPWVVTFALYFASAFLGVVGLWLVVGWSRWHPSLREIFSTLAAVVLVLALGEAGLRQLPAWQPGAPRPAPGVPGAFVADDRLGWRLAPDRRHRWRTATVTVAYDASPQGFRQGGPPDAPAARSGARAIAFVGGTQTFGAGVPFERTYPALVARRTGHRVRNLALPGFTMLQRARVFDGVALDPPPRAVVLAVTDPERWPAPPPSTGDTLSVPQVIHDGGELRPPRPGETAAPAFAWLEAHSGLWRALYGLDEWLGRRVEWGDLSVTQLRLLERIYRRAQAENVPVLFVRLPAPEPRAYPLMQDLFHALGAAYLDLGARGKDRPGRWWRPDGSSLTPQGHRWIADAVQDRLSRLLE